MRRPNERTGAFDATLNRVIILIIVILLLAAPCDCGDPPPSVVVPPPPTCATVVLCVADCGDVATTSCAPCPAGTFDATFCSDGGPPPMDGGACDDVPCTRANECGYACGEIPFYVGCCDCPAGTFDLVTACGTDAGPPDAADATVDAELDAGDAGDAGDAAPPDAGLLPTGSACFDDRQCASGLCYGEADATGAFLPPTCQAICLPPDDRGFWCRNDRHCCEGTCCRGCGELEGLCRLDP